MSLFELSGQGTDRIESKVTFALPDHVEDMTLVGSAAINATGNGLANQLTGNSAGNVLRGGDGNDILYGGEAADRMEGGKHDDLYYVDDAGDVVVELSGQGTDTVMSRIAHTLAANVENLTLHGGGAISGTGNTLANTITGNAAANRLDGGAGADTMIGGSGHDTYVIDHVSDVVVEEGSGGVDSVYSAVDYRLPTHFEKLYLTGTAGRDGRANSMDNILVGNSGGNLLNGGSGDDRIDGGAGNDLIYGHTGKDDLTGGAGADRFLFNTDLAASNVDRIRDFSVVDDRIDLADYVFTRAGGRGALAASAFRTGTAAGDASDRIVYDSASGNLFYDPDGTGAAAQMLFAVVNAGTALTHADFYVYG
jgi:Ca2+-binding RTX toxin-like protein